MMAVFKARLAISGIFEVVFGGRKMIGGQGEKEKKNKTKNAMEGEMKRKENIGF